MRIAFCNATGVLAASQFEFTFGVPSDFGRLIEAGQVLAGSWRKKLCANGCFVLACDVRAIQSNWHFRLIADVRPGPCASLRISRTGCSFLLEHFRPLGSPDPNQRWSNNPVAGLALYYRGSASSCQQPLFRRGCLMIASIRVKCTYRKNSLSLTKNDRI